MNRINGDLSIESYVVARLTCGHAILLDRYSGPEDENDIVPHPGEALIYCTRCGTDAQIAKIIDKERITQVVTCWNYSRNRIARDNDAKREALRLRETDDSLAGQPGLTYSPGDSGVSRDEGVVDSTEGASTGGPTVGEDQSGNVLAPRSE